MGIDLRCDKQMGDWIAQCLPVYSHLHPHLGPRWSFPISRCCLLWPPKLTAGDSVVVVTASARFAQVTAQALFARQHTSRVRGFQSSFQLFPTQWYTAFNAYFTHSNHVTLPQTHVKIVPISLPCDQSKLVLSRPQGHLMEWVLHRWRFWGTRERRGPTKGHMASKWKNWVSNPGLLTLHLALWATWFMAALWGSSFFSSLALWEKDALKDSMCWLFAFAFHK